MPNRVLAATLSQDGLVKKRWSRYLPYVKTVVASNGCAISAIWDVRVQRHLFADRDEAWYETGSGHYPPKWIPDGSYAGG